MLHTYAHVDAKAQIAVATSSGSILFWDYKVPVGGEGYYWAALELSVGFKILK